MELKIMQKIKHKNELNLRQHKSRLKSKVLNI